MITKLFSKVLIPRTNSKPYYTKSTTHFKYFQDTQLKNFVISTHNSQGIIAKIMNIMNKKNIQATYIQSQLGHIQIDKKQSLDVKLSIKNPESNLIQFIQKDLKQIDCIIEAAPIQQIDWFPRNSEELDLIGKVLINVKDDFGNDSAQFKDQQYRKRRDYIAQASKTYKMNDPIPQIKYLESQNKTWSYCFQKLRRLHKIAMCSRFQKNMLKMEKQFNMKNQIPQLSQLDKFLRAQTNFRIKPTHGILSQRQFFNALGHRVFCCTQYIRHGSVPQYTPQPDIIHQVFGHVPMFADKQVADFSHQIGLLSLGASDQQIAQLGSLYWFTIQFGVCRQNDKILGYGAGIGSSFGQIQHFLSDKPKFQDFNPIRDAKLPYPIQSVQPVYKVAKSFEDSLHQLKLYGKTLTKTVTNYYDFNNNTIKYDRQIKGIFRQ